MLSHMNDSCENIAIRQFYAFGVIDCVVLFHSWWRIVINDPTVSKLDRVKEKGDDLIASEAATQYRTGPLPVMY